MSEYHSHTKWQVNLTPGRAANDPPSDTALRTTDDACPGGDSILPPATHENIYIAVNEPSPKRFGFVMLDMRLGDAILGRLIHWRGEPGARLFDEQQSYRLLRHLDNLFSFDFSYDEDEAGGDQTERNYNQVLQWLRRYGKPTSGRMSVPAYDLSIRPEGDAA